MIKLHFSKAAVAVGRLTRERAVAVYAAALALATVALAGGLVAAGVGTEAAVWELGLLAAAAFLTERQPVRISETTEITVSVLPILFAAVAFGPLDAMVVAAGGILGDFARRDAAAPTWALSFVRWSLWTSLRALAGGAAGIAAVLIDRATADGALGLVLGVSAAALVEAIVDIALGAGVVALRTGGWRDYLRSVRLALLGTVPLYAPVLVALVSAYESLGARLGALSWLLFFGPAFAAHRFYRLYEEQKRAARD